MFDAIDLAIRVGGGVEDAVLVHDQRLHLQFLGFENGGGLALRRDAIDAGGSSGGGIEDFRSVGGDRPDVGRWRGRERLERGREFEAAGAANGHAGGRALAQFVKLGLFPGASAFAESEMNNGEQENRNSKE